MISGPGHATSHHHYINLLKSFDELAKNFLEFNFIYKTHPKEDPEICKKFLKSNNFIILDNMNLNNLSFFSEELILLSNALISGSSASILDAFDYNKPVFTLDLEDEYSNFDFIGANTTIHSTNIEKLIDDFQKFIDNPNHFASIQNNAVEFLQGQYKYREEEATNILYKTILNKLKN